MDGTSKMAKESTKKSQIRSWVPGAWGSAVSQLGSVDHLDLWVSIWPLGWGEHAQSSKFVGPTRFNQSLEHVIWPESLESLTFGSGFNQSLALATNVSRVLPAFQWSKHLLHQSIACLSIWWLSTPHKLCLKFTCIHTLADQVILRVWESDIGRVLQPELG